MTNAQNNDSVKGYECKHALYFAANDGSPHDLLVIKEYKHFKDGRREPYLRLIGDYKRPFYVTRDAHRKHKDKKEWEHIERLQRYECTQIELPKRVCQALGRAYTGNPSQDLRKAFSSPYVYGCDADTPLLAKRRYMDKYPGCVSDNLVAVLDSETDVVDGHEEPIMLSLTMGNKAKIVIVRQFMEGIHDPETQIRGACQKYLNDPNSDIGDIFNRRGIQLEIEWANNAGEASYKIIQTAHQWQPDILTIWNMNFDVPKMCSVLVKYNYDLADVWSDPKIPGPFRHFRYIEGPAVKKTASGKQMSLSAAERWHVVECPASFYVLDAMCVYLKLRIAKGKEPSYALDAILNKHLGLRKLKFKEADGYSGLALHQFMQTNYKVEYCVYNLFDCISMEMLDEKITDLRRMVGLMCGHSPYARFPSQPKRTVDDLYFFALEHGKVTATCSRDMVTELDELVVGLENWIVTLPSYLVHDDGLCALEELPGIHTNLWAHVADLDVEGTYPNEEILMNISKETTAQELAKVEGISEQTRRAVGINLSGGFVNAVEIVVKTYGAPTMDTMLAAFEANLQGLAPTNLPLLDFDDEELVVEIAEEDEEESDEESEEMA